MRFVKMHGAGNDYVYVDCFSQPQPENPARVAKLVSDRHFGIGSDGLILICPSQVADVRMRMFNADGSEAQMCGNGIRCVAKYVYDHGLCRQEQIRVETGAGVLTLQVQVGEDGKVARVRVDMGPPRLQAQQIPTTLPGDPVVHAPLKVEDRTFEVTCVSMGNPHCVIFVPQITDELVHHWGPKIEHHEAFPQRVNVEFVEVLSPDRVRVRVWERGTGETLACGTGACAVCVAGVLTQRTHRDLVALLPGGELLLSWNAQDDHVYMTGPAVEVFEGTWLLPLE